MRTARRNEYLHFPLLAFSDPRKYANFEFSFTDIFHSFIFRGPAILCVQKAIFCNINRDETVKRYNYITYTLYIYTVAVITSCSLAGHTVSSLSANTCGCRDAVFRTTLSLSLLLADSVTTHCKCNIIIIIT